MNHRLDCPALDYERVRSVAAPVVIVRCVDCHAVALAPLDGTSPTHQPPSTHRDDEDHDRRTRAGRPLR